MTPPPEVRWTRINRALLLIPLLVAVVLSAWTAPASAEAPYVVYTANNTSQGAVILRSDPATGSLVEISRNGAQGNLFVRPYDLAVERNGDLVVADLGQPNVKDGAVIRVNPYTGRQTLVSSGDLFFDPAGITVAPDGSIYVIDNLFGPTGGIVIKVDPHTGAQQLIASNFNPPALFDHSFGIAVDRDGSILVANRSIAGDLPAGCGLAGSVLRVNPADGTQSLVAGPSIPPNLLSYPVGLAVDSTGAVFVANECPGGAGLVRVGGGGAQTSVTPNGGADVLRTPERVGITPAGNYVISDFNGGADSDGSIVEVTPGGVQRTLSSGALFNHPLGIAVVPNLPPIASLRLSRAVIPAGGQVTLDASGSRDPEGLQLVYEWDLDGNGTFETGSGTTPSASPRFATGGTRTLRVRVNDPHGGRSVATALLRVDGSTPVVTQLKSAARVLRLRRSTTIRFRLSEPAAVTVTLSRASSGRRVKGLCSRNAKRGRSCVAWARVRTIKREARAGSNAIKLRGRGLKPGHYRLTLTAVDDVGHRSSARSMRLRVVK